MSESEESSESVKLELDIDKISIRTSDKNVDDHPKKQWFNTPAGLTLLGGVLVAIIGGSFSWLDNSNDLELEKEKYKNLKKIERIKLKKSLLDSVSNTVEKNQSFSVSTEYLKGVDLDEEGATESTKKWASRIIYRQNKLLAEDNLRNLLHTNSLAIKSISFLMGSDVYEDTDFIGAKGIPKAIICELFFVFHYAIPLIEIYMSKIPDEVTCKTICQVDYINKTQSNAEGGCSYENLVEVCSEDDIKNKQSRKRILKTYGEYLEVAKWTSLNLSRNLNPLHEKPSALKCKANESALDTCKTIHDDFKKDYEDYIKSNPKKKDIIKNYFNMIYGLNSTKKSFMPICLSDEKTNLVFSDNYGGNQRQEE